MLFVKFDGYYKNDFTDEITKEQINKLKCQHDSAPKAVK